MNVYWLEQSEASVPPDDDWLSTAECERLARLRVPKRRNDWRLGRWTAKQAVAAWLRLPATALVLAQIEIVAAPDGAPEVVVVHRSAALNVSLSHRAGIALCTIAPAGALGCDLEIVEPHSASFVADYFTDKEQQCIAKADVEDRDRLLAIFWSAKESALKALRVGLRIDTRDIKVTLPSGVPDVSGWGALEVHAAEGRIFHGWWQENEDFVRTVVSDAMPQPPIRLRISERVAIAACA